MWRELAEVAIAARDAAAREEARLERVSRRAIQKMRSRTATTAFSRWRLEARERHRARGQMKKFIWRWHRAKKRAAFNKWATLNQSSKRDALNAFIHQKDEELVEHKKLTAEEVKATKQKAAEAREKAQAAERELAANRADLQRRRAQLAETMKSMEKKDETHRERKLGRILLRFTASKAVRCVLYKSFSPIARFQRLIASPFN
jgi:hypothetical protein